MFQKTGLQPAAQEHAHARTTPSGARTRTPLQSTHTHPLQSTRVILCSGFAAPDSAFVLGARGHPRTPRPAFGGKTDSKSKFCGSSGIIPSHKSESDPVTRMWNSLQLRVRVVEPTFSLLLFRLLVNFQFPSCRYDVFPLS